MQSRDSQGVYMFKRDKELYVAFRLQYVSSYLDIFFFFYFSELFDCDVFTGADSTLPVKKK